jgi:endonuclease/exonuclease/phosphatase (EEP) superfamily protein YafD
MFNRKKRKGNSLLRTIDAVMFVLTLSGALALAMSYFAPRTNPNDAWVFAFFGLGAPLLYFANLALLLYWMFRWKPVFLLPAVVLLCGWGNISTFYRLPFGKSYGETEQRGTITVLSFNTEGFVRREGEESFSTAEEIVRWVVEQDPDIICFQEYQSTPKNPREKIDTLLAAWPHSRIANFLHQNGRGVLGVALYSKFPILASGEIEFLRSNNGTLYADLLTGRNDTLRVINNHLQTTKIDRSNLAFFDYDNFAQEPDKEGKIRQIAGRLRDGYRLRADQADSIASLIRSRQVPTIVVGDFNDTPVSYTYRTIRGGYADSFEEKGSGYHYTYKNLFRMLRIDYILHSSGLETVAYDSPEVPWSDHNPVVATFIRKK